MTRSDPAAPRKLAPFKTLARLPRSLYQLVKQRASTDGVSVNQEIVLLLAGALGVPPVDAADDRLRLQISTLATPTQVFDEYNGGSSVGWIAHRFQLEEPVVRRTVEKQLRERLEKCLKESRTTPKRVHISIVTAPLSWQGR
jgi:hypothetical protein